MAELIPGLPDEIAVRCIAAVPLNHHALLSLVSRSWRSLLLSPLFSYTRSTLFVSERVLLLTLRSVYSTHYLLLFPPPLCFSPRSLPPPPLATSGPSLVPAGNSTLYVLGGSHNNIDSAAVQILDVRASRWRAGPRMLSSRQFAAGARINDKIYVIGGCNQSARSWAESFDVSNCGVEFDTGRRRWVAVESPASVRGERWMHGCVVMGRRMLAVSDHGGIAFDPGSGEWSAVSSTLDLGWKGRAAVVNGVLYTYDFLGKVRGYNGIVDEWKQVEGLEGHLPRFLCGATLADFGGLLCLLWEKRDGQSSSSKGKMEIEMAGIDVTKSSNGGLRGSIIWRELIALDVLKGSLLTHCIALEL